MATVNFLPGTLDINAYQGDSMSLSLTFKDELGAPIDLTGLTFEAEIRDKIADDSAFIPVTMQCVIADAVNGVLEVTVIPSATEPLNGNYVYDLQGTDAGGDVRTYVAGKITFKGEITRP